MSIDGRPLDDGPAAAELGHHHFLGGDGRYKRTHGYEMLKTDIYSEESGE